MGKWSISVKDMPRRVYPDFCPGWLYVTTPKAGLALAEVSVRNAEVLMATARLDDIFVTGFLRERLPGIMLRQLQRLTFSYELIKRKAEKALTSFQPAADAISDSTNACTTCA